MLDDKMIDAVERAMTGDNDAFVEMCELKARDILYVCIRLMNNQYDGEAVATEVIRKMHATITELDDPQNFNVWLYRIIKEMCDIWREKREVFVYNVIRNEPKEE